MLLQHTEVKICHSVIQAVLRLSINITDAKEEMSFFLVQNGNTDLREVLQVSLV
jgi:hypothetical protein